MAVGADKLYDFDTPTGGFFKQDSTHGVSDFVLSSGSEAQFVAKMYISAYDISAGIFEATTSYDTINRQYCEERNDAIGAHEVAAKKTGQTMAICFRTTENKLGKMSLKYVSENMITVSAVIWKQPLD